MFIFLPALQLIAGLVFVLLNLNPFPNDIELKAVFIGGEVFRDNYVESKPNESSSKSGPSQLVYGYGPRASRLLFTDLRF